MKPGYKQTEVGVIPDDWEEITLGEVIDLLTGFPFPSSGYSDSGCRLLRGSNVKRGVTDWSEHLVSYWPSVTPPIRQYLLQEGDIVIAMDGSLVGRSFAELGESDLPALLLQRVARVRARSASQRYLSVCIRSEAFTKHCDSVKTTTAIPHISPSDIRSFRISLPPTRAEQEAIAAALSDVDALLAALDRLLAKKRDLKQAAMQQLLTGQTRLPGFEGEWEVKTLGNIGTFKNGLNKDSSAFGHGSPFVNLMDVFGVNAIRSKCHLGLVASTKMDREVYNLRQGDVLFIRSSVKPSGVGLTAVVECDLTDTVYSGFLIRFRDDGVLDSGFKKHCFYAENFRRKIIAASSVSANTNINQNALRGLTLPLPPTKTEQTAIAAVLSAMDAELAALEQRRDKTRALKQGMMQELLTGKTRLL